MKGSVPVVLACLILAASPGPPGSGASPEVRVPSPAGGTLEGALFRPSGDERFPGAIVSHGEPRDPSRRRSEHPDFNRLRTWLVNQGYAVLVPMRRGFGSSDGENAEGYGKCESADYLHAGLAGADDIDAAIRYMRDQPFVDSSRIVLIGQSAGGFATIAEASRNPQGLVAAVNFAGGRGSIRPDVVCSADRLVATMGTFGKSTRVPTLWIYAQNDHFFGPSLAKRMFDAFSAGSPKAEFFAAPPFENEGHNLAHGAGWEDVMATFLKKVVPPP